MTGFADGFLSVLAVVEQNRDFIAAIDAEFRCNWSHRCQWCLSHPVQLVGDVEQLGSVATDLAGGVVDQVFSDSVLVLPK